MTKFAIITPTFGVPFDDDGFPVYRPWGASTGKGIGTDVKSLSRELGIPWVFGGISPHDRSRCFLAAKALKETDADAFLWLDDDIDDAELQCVKLMDEFDMETHTTLTGVYVCRHAVKENTIALNYNPVFDDGERNVEVLHYEHGGIREVTAHGFGFCITPRRLFDRMAAPGADYSDYTSPVYPGKAWFLPAVVGRAHLGEDRSFTWRVGAQGLGKMYVDTRICARHAGYDLRELMS